MGSDVNLPPIATPGATADFLRWARLDVDLKPWVQALPRLTLLPGITAPIDPERPQPVLRIWDVLASWRAAERELARATLDSPELPRIHADLVGLRAAYHRLFREQMSPTSQVLRVVAQR